MEFKKFMEALKGNQHKLDKNKNGKLDAHDFKLLRKEEEECEYEDEDEKEKNEKEMDEAVERVARADYKESPSGRKTHKQITFKDGSPEDDESKKVSEEVELEERTMTDAEMKKREEIVKGMKKNVAGFKSKYGERAKEVMYATATKMAMKEESELEEQAPVAPSLVKHRIGVTVSEPDHPMVSKRKEKVQKFVIVTHSSNKEGAKAVGEKYYKKKGYRVHDSHHAGMVNEQVGLEEGYVVRYNNPKSEKHGSEKHFQDQAAAQKHADRGNSVDKIGGKYTVHKTNEKGHDMKEEAEQLQEYGDTAKGQKMLAKVQKRATDRLIKADDKNRLEPDVSKRDLKTVRKNAATAQRAYDRMDEAFDGSKVTIHAPGHRLHGKTGSVFHRHDDGRVNVQVRHSNKRGDVTNLTLNKDQYKEVQKEEVELDEAFPYDVDHMPGKIGSRPISGQHGDTGSGKKDTYVKTFHAKKEKEAHEFAKSKGYVVKKHTYPPGHNNQYPHEFQVHKEEAELDEAVESGNKGYGYHGQHDSETADKKYSAMHAKVKKVAGEAGHLRDAKKPNVMVKHYLDSRHGRHLAGNEHDHEYIKKDFGKFKKSYKESDFAKESVGFDDEGNLVSQKVSFSDFLNKINEQLLEYETKSGVYRHKGSYGSSYQGDDDEDDDKPKKPAEPAVKRGRGRPAGSKSGANQKVGSGKSYGGIAHHTLNLPTSK